MRRHTATVGVLFLLSAGGIVGGALWLAERWPGVSPHHATSTSRSRDNSQPITTRNVSLARSSQNGASPRLLESYGKLPLAFEKNLGQSKSPAQFISRGSSYNLFLTPQGPVLALSRARSRFGKLAGRLGAPVAAGLSRHGGNGNDYVSPVRPLLAELGESYPALGMARAGAQSVPDFDSQEAPQPPEVLRLELAGANTRAKVEGLEELPGKSNYFIGNDPKKWRTNVPNYRRVRYKNVYPGIDLDFYGKQGQLEYDFVVQPGADPRSIALRLEAGNSKLENRNSKIEIGRDGALVVNTDSGELRLVKPVVYQEKSTVTTDNGQQTTNGFNRQSSIDNRQFLEGRYVLSANNQIRFELPSYDKSRALVIDPVLSYSTYLGGGNYDIGTGVAVDSSGNAYIVGETQSTDFPIQSALQPTLRGGSNAFVTKLNPTGTALVYSTYLGGSGYDSGSGIALDPNGFVYIVGTTSSADFPTSNPIQPSYGSNSDTFVAELDPSGAALVFSTYLGGSGREEGHAIALDPSGAVYLTGLTFSSDFPVLNAVQSVFGGGIYYGDAFVTKLNPASHALVYSTYLGGSNDDIGNAIAVDSSGNAVVAGYTASTNFPTVNPLQPSYGGGTSDAFVAKLDSTGSTLVFSTYLGGSGDDAAFGIALDTAGDIYVDGSTASGNFPTQKAFQPSNAGAGHSNAFVTELDPTGTAMVFSTYLGGAGGDQAQAIALDSLGNIYLTGGTSSYNFPTVDPIQPSLTTSPSGAFNAFVSEFNASASALLFSTFLGCGEDSAQGIVVDSSGSMFVTGTTACSGFPTVNPFQAGFHGTEDVFVSKISRPPKVVLSAPSLTFSGQLIGTTSTAQTATVTNSGESPLSIANIAASGDFVESDDCPASPATLAIGSNCTLSVTFAPTARGTRTGAITVTDNAPDTPQTITLSGTGLSGPSASLSPTSLTFPDQYVGTTGLPLTVTVTNNGDSPLTISSVQTSAADFGTLNACTSKVDAGVSCAIGVFFDPTQSGTRTAQLSVADDSPGSPQTVSLTGVGQDFTMTSSTPTASVVAGHTGTYDLKLAPTPRFTGTVSLTCSGFPPQSTCTISPNSVTLKGTDAAVAAVSVTTASGSTLLPLPPGRTPGRRYFEIIIGLWLLAMAGLTVWSLGRQQEGTRIPLGMLRRRSWASLTLATALGLLLLWTACGGGARTGGTPSGTYFLQISGTATSSSGTGSLTHNVVLNLTVQ